MRNTAVHLSSVYASRGAALGLLVALATQAGVEAAPTASSLRTVETWGYQLQAVDPAAVAAAPYDLMVIDYAQDGSAGTVFDATQVAMMQRKPDGRPRLVLAYLSIGEAEDYRFYWRPEWTGSPPAWLGAENPDWPGNYTVSYWDADWQHLMMGRPDAYLDAIIAAGFDGVYLDRVDAFDVPAPEAGHAERMARMASFVASLAAYARSERADFVVVAQNAEELLAYPNYAEAIDAVAKEDLFFGLDGDGVLNSKSELRASLTPLLAFQASGKPVFLVEYLSENADIAVARENAKAMGAPLFIGKRALDNVQSH